MEGGGARVEAGGNRELMFDAGHAKMTAFNTVSVLRDVPSAVKAIAGNCACGLKWHFDAVTNGLRYQLQWYK